MKILMTGATGLLGLNTVPQLLEAGHEVVVRNIGKVIISALTIPERTATHPVADFKVKVFGWEVHCGPSDREHDAESSGSWGGVSAL
jgi:nucleoside-diphosphate-sugar epimerase